MSSKQEAQGAKEQRFRITAQCCKLACNGVTCTQAEQEKHDQCPGPGIEQAYEQVGAHKKTGKDQRKPKPQRE